MEFFSLDYVEAQMGRPITGVIHIGAHYAQEAADYDNYGAPVIWVEAHEPYFEKAYEHLQQFDNQVVVNFCLDNQSGKSVDFFLTSDECSSSLLERAAHKDLWPHITDGGIVKIETSTFDEMWDHIVSSGYVGNTRHNLLVLDVQGAELRVWEGISRKIRNKFDAIISEYSTIEIYKNIPHLAELEDAFEGFVRVFPIKTVQHGDALFIREELVIQSI